MSRPLYLLPLMLAGCQSAPSVSAPTIARIPPPVAIPALQPTGLVVGSPEWIEGDRYRRRALRSQNP